MTNKSLILFCSFFLSIFLGGMGGGFTIINKLFGERCQVFCCAVCSVCFVCVSFDNRIFVMTTKPESIILFRQFFKNSVRYLVKLVYCFRKCVLIIWKNCNRKWPHAYAVTNTISNILQFWCAWCSWFCCNCLKDSRSFCVAHLFPPSVCCGLFGLPSWSQVGK